MPLSRQHGAHGSAQIPTALNRINSTARIFYFLIDIIVDELMFQKRIFDR